MEQPTVKPFPGWKNAEQEILQIVERQGYGVMLNHATLHEWFDIKEPKEYDTKEAWQKYTLELLASTQSLIDSLLIEHNICLYNIRGEGYQILHPDEQVDRGAEKHMKKMHKEWRKMVATLTCVNDDHLSVEGQRKQINKLTMAAKIKSSLHEKIITDDERDEQAINSRGLLGTSKQQDYKSASQGMAGCG